MKHPPYRELKQIRRCKCIENNYFLFEDHSSQYSCKNASFLHGRCKEFFGREHNTLKSVGHYGWPKKNKLGLWDGKNGQIWYFSNNFTLWKLFNSKLIFPLHNTQKFQLGWVINSYTDLPSLTTTNVHIYLPINLKYKFCFWENQT